MPTNKRTVVITNLLHTRVQNRTGHPLLETICRFPFESIAISAVHLQEDPGVSHNQICVIFRNRTQNLAHDH